MFRPLHITTAMQLRDTPGAITLIPSEAWHRPEPSFVADLSEAGDRGPPPGKWRTEKSERFRHSLHDQLVFGSHHLHALVGEGEVFNCQNLEWAKNLLEHHIDHHPGPQFNIPRFRRDGEEFSVSYEGFDAAAAVPLDGPVFLGSPIEPANWGLWLLQGLPAIADFVAMGQPGRFLCYTDFPWQHAMLAFMGLDPDKLLHQGAWVSYRAADITLHQYADLNIIPRAEDIALFADIRERASARVDAPKATRLFLSRRSAARRPGAYRVMTNEDALIDALAPLGLTVVEPEFLSFEQQVALFSQAEVVVGLGGAAMFNTVFCRPGTRVVSIESTTAFVHNHTNVFAGMGHQFAFILGQEDASANAFPHNPWSIDPARAAALVASFI
jgi:hypothetical protein